MPSTGRARRAAGTVTVYVANTAGNTVTPIRAASNTARRPIRVGRGPALIAISPDGQTAYVVGVGSTLPDVPSPVTLTPIRTATNRPGREITVCAAENLGGVISPGAIAITPDSRTVYVSCSGMVVPVRAGADTASEPVRLSSAGALAMAADGRTLYVANPDGATITPVSTATGEPGPPIVVDSSPDGVVLTPDGTTVLVLTSAGVTPVDTATNRGPENAVQDPGRRPVPEACLRAGPRHSDPRRDELGREADKGRPAPERHRDQRRARGAEDYFCCMCAAISASTLRGEDRDVEEPSESKDAEKCHERRCRRAGVEVIADEVDILGADQPSDLGVDLGEASELVQFVELGNGDVAGGVLGV
jgi:sugar lactone lactonase YvrE